MPLSEKLPICPRQTKMLGICPRTVSRLSVAAFWPPDAASPVLWSPISAATPNSQLREAANLFVVFCIFIRYKSLIFSDLWLLFRIILNSRKKIPISHTQISSLSIRIFGLSFSLKCTLMFFLSEVYLFRVLVRSWLAR